MDPSSVEEWKEDLRKYEQEKTNISWTSAVPHPRITHNDMQALENRYNPILQTYTDPEIERNVQKIERDRLIETLAKNKDRSLRYEQTFDIINLDDKLKGLEGLPGYPVEKPPNYKSRNLGNNSKTPYNIISCLDFIDHHYLPPEHRPPRPIEKPKTYKINIVEHRDFNIISNKYIQGHEEKAKKDLESYKLQAAEEYWKAHDYDIFTCKYIDPEKEELEKKNAVNDALTLCKKKYEELPNGVKYSEGALYQAISSKVVDAARLYEIDMKNKQAKKRFENRYDIEKEYHDRDIEFQEKAKFQAINRISHERYTEDPKRGYDIINHNPYEGMNAKTLYPSKTNPKPSVWERALSQKSDVPATPSMPSRFSTPNRPIRSSGFKIVS
ncbi:hypothetical protein SteCoe_35794 [Stentor coeruleus]|uniref:Uncharacterized protein n=1 Tax=Stentor coeruleus TaxID=5963 RepID=A0A1R2ARJ9_9CILI|nr:hypothetical protein SteCoe_35794 [Stentor coeruleus]